MANIRDVAKLAGVSVATVSRALSNPTQVSSTRLESVQKAILAVDYRPNMLAQHFRAAKTSTIVVLVPDITNSFFSEVIRSIEDRAQQQGYGVLLCDTRDMPEREKDYIFKVETRLADGIIQLRPDDANSALKVIPDYIASVNACGCESTKGPRVRIDNRGAAKKMADHLVELGHTRIGVITGLNDNPHTQDRLAGFNESLAAADIQFDPTLVLEGDFRISSGLECAETFCNMENPPTAIFCMNDDMAIGAMKMLKMRNFKIPEDISVTGFDNINHAQYLDPGLTTISQPAADIGKQAMEMLLQVMDGTPLAQTEFIAPNELIVRESTAPPRNAHK